MRHAILTSFRRILAHFTVDDLNRTFEAHLLGETIRGQYSAPDGKGCLIHHLTGGQVASRQQLRDYFGSQIGDYVAASLLIAAYDNEELTDDDISWELLDAIEERIALNAAEQQTVDDVIRRLTTPK